eukprot:scaffold182031_cov33-Tisochrysis_lutea.AAC.5
MRLVYVASPESACHEQRDGSGRTEQQRPSADGLHQPGAGDDESSMSMTTTGSICEETKGDRSAG